MVWLKHIQRLATQTHTHVHQTAIVTTVSHSQQAGYTKSVYNTLGRKRIAGYIKYAS